MSRICVFIHGYLTNFRDFTTLPSKLIGHYDRIIILSLPGHQEGQLRKFKKADVFTYLHDEFDTLFVDPNNKVDVVGFSLGGALTWYLSHHYKFNKIVLLSPAIFYLNPQLVVDERKFFNSLKNLDEEQQKEEKRKFKERRKTALNFAKKNTLTKFNLQNAYQFVRIINEVKKYKDDINIPMLIVRGNLDELVSMKSVDFCLKHNINPNVKKMLIKDIGHMMLRTDRGEEIIEKITNFLEDNTNE